MVLVNSKNQTKRNLKKSIQINHNCWNFAKLETRIQVPICSFKTRNKNSSPDMFNFDVDLAGYDMVTDAGWAILCTLNFRGPSLSTKRTKNEGHFGNMIFSKKPFENFNEKKIKHTSSLDQTTALTTRLLKTKIENGPC